MTVSGDLFNKVVEARKELNSAIEEAYSFNLKRSNIALRNGSRKYFFNCIDFVLSLEDGVVWAFYLDWCKHTWPRLLAEMEEDTGQRNDKAIRDAYSVLREHAPKMKLPLDNA